MVTDTYNPITQEVEMQEHKKYKIVLKYTVCSRSVWDAWDPVSKNIE